MTDGRTDKARSRKALKRYLQRTGREAVAAAQRMPQSLQHDELAARKRIASFGRARMIEEVATDGRKLQWANESFKEHRGLVVAAVRNHGLALCHAGPACKKDSLIALAAVKQNRMAMEFAPSRVASDRQVALHMVQKDGLALQHLHLM